MTTENPGAPPRTSTVSARDARRRGGAGAPMTKPMVLAGVAGACVLGLGLGLLARPQLAADARTPGSMKPVEQMQIEIDREEPLPAVEGGKLELLPTGLSVPPVIAAPQPAILPPSDLTPVVRPAPVMRPAPARPTTRGPSFNCAQSATAAEELICGDEALAAQDRQLATSWRRALDAGVPMGRLRRQQQHWLNAREDAARNAPEDVADLYDQRIQELDEVAGYDR